MICCDRLILMSANHGLGEAIVRLWGVMLHHIHTGIRTSGRTGRRHGSSLRVDVDDSGGNVDGELRVLPSSYVTLDFFQVSRICVRWLCFRTSPTVRSSCKATLVSEQSSYEWRGGSTSWRTKDKTKLIIRIQIGPPISNHLPSDAEWHKISPRLTVVSVQRDLDRSIMDATLISLGAHPDLKRYADPTG